MTTLDLVRQLEALGAHVTLAPLSAVKGFCRIEHTESGWLLQRTSQDRRGSFFAQYCTEGEALRMIRDGDVARETEALSAREQARRVLSQAVRTHFDPDTTQGALLFEAIDALAS